MDSDGDEAAAETEADSDATAADGVAATPVENGAASRVGAGQESGSSSEEEECEEGEEQVAKMARVNAL